MLFIFFNDTATTDIYTDCHTLSLHDARPISLATCREVMAKAKVTAAEVAGIGITNQRETTVVWDRETGKAVHNAIVWQDRRTADLCARLKRERSEEHTSELQSLMRISYAVFCLKTNQ